MPYGSLTVGQSGGALHPAIGAISRASRPAGISSSARPMANAAWGMASIGPSACVRRCHSGVPQRCVTSTRQASSASAVLSSPVLNDSASARGSCGSASSARQAAPSPACSKATGSANASGSAKISSGAASAVRSAAVIAALMRSTLTVSAQPFAL